MELLMNMLWVYPAVAMTAFTLLTLLLAWTLPLNRRVPFIISGHIILAISNPKDDFLYKRPSLRLAVIFLVAGVIPVVCALVLAAEVLMYGIYVVEPIKKFMRKPTLGAPAARAELIAASEFSKEKPHPGGAA